MAPSSPDLPILLKPQAREAENGIPGVSVRRKTIRSGPLKSKEITKDFFSAASGLHSTIFHYSVNNSPSFADRSIAQR